jgi:hypothetical protein
MCLFTTLEFVRFSSRVGNTIVGPRPMGKEIIE